MQSNNALLAKYNELFLNASNSEVLMRINEQLKPVLLRIDNEAALAAMSPIKIGNFKTRQLVLDTINLIDDAHWQNGKKAWKMTDLEPMGIKREDGSYLYPQIRNSSLYRLKLSSGHEIITWIDKERPFLQINENDNLYFREDIRAGLFEPKFTRMQEAYIRAKYIDKLNDLMLSIDHLKADEEDYVLFEIPIANFKNSIKSKALRQYLVLYKDGTIFALSKRLDNTFCLSNYQEVAEFLNNGGDCLIDFFANSAYFANYPEIKQNVNREEYPLCKN